MAAFVAAIFSATALFADDAPWNFSAGALDFSQDPPSKSLASDITRLFINIYRKNSSQVSIPRCIFHVSCSHFAEKAISQKGFFMGTIMFIDRYFYRENNSARSFYPLIGENDGTYRFNDALFLSEEPPTDPSPLFY